MSGQPFTVFVVEDNDWYNRLLVHHIELNPEYEAKGFSNAKDLLAALSEKPGAVTLDFRLPDMDGLEVLRRIKEYDASIEVVVISEQEEIETAVELLKSGAYDYLVKSDDIKERLHKTLTHIRQHAGLKEKIVRLEREVGKKYDFSSALVGESDAMKRIHGMIEKSLNNNLTVTITGETGTGKEVVAKVIHYNSNRKSGPFVPVNMAAIPSELIESELFGHEKGAFTGAIGKRIGKFEEAEGGTLFLDEIGEMDAVFQAKLLRALQEREVVRVGSNKPIKIDCRIVVATNRNLLEEVKKGRFRSDLYYRIFGLPIELPALRERGNDILLLARKFIEGFCKENQMEAKVLGADARKKLLQYPWPGNVRELKSVVELAVVMSAAQEISADDITLAGESGSADLFGEERTMREYELIILKHYLKKYNNIRVVAEKLDIGQTTIYRMLKEDPSGEGNEMGPAPDSQ